MSMSMSTLCQRQCNRFAVACSSNWTCCQLSAYIQLYMLYILRQSLHLPTKCEQLPHGVHCLGVETIGSACLVVEAIRSVIFGVDTSWHLWARLLEQCGVICRAIGSGLWWWWPPPRWFPILGQTLARHYVSHITILYDNVGQTLARANQTVH